MPNLIEQISQDLTVPQELLEKACRLAHFKYRKIKVPKRSGNGYRTFTQTTPEIKLIQSWLLLNFFPCFSVSSIASAFLKGASILKNARVHKNGRYSVRVDMVDFFPSLRFCDLVGVIKAKSGSLPAVYLEQDSLTLLHRVCFDGAGRLPIGYSTSPIISNLLMYEFDNRLSDIVNSDPSVYGNSKVSRYADDFVFSSDKPGACKSFVDAVFQLTNEIKSPSLKVNGSKTRFMSRAGGSTLVTGLRINQQGVVRVHPDYRDHVRLLLKLFSQDRLKAGELQRLRGHLAYIESTDPRLFTRLSFRYFDEIARIRNQ